MTKITLKTNKKKLELKKTAIANLTLNAQQLGMIVGGEIIAAGSRFIGEGDCTIRTHGGRPTNRV